MNIKYIKESIRSIYDFSVDAISILDKGMSGRKYIITENGVRYIFKLFDCDEKNIINIIKNETLFFQKKVLMPDIIPQFIGGKLYTKVENNVYGIMYRFLPGKEMLRLNTHSVEKLAKLLAFIHSLSLLKNKEKNIYDIKKIKKVFDEKYTHLKGIHIFNKSLKHTIIEVLSIKHSILDEYKDFTIETHSKQVIHGDFHQRNVLCHNNSIYLLDFEKSRCDSKYIELIRSLHAICFKGDFSDFKYNRARIFLEEYKKHSKINSRELFNSIHIDIIKKCNTWLEENLLLDSGFIKKPNIKLLLRRELMTMRYFKKNKEVYIKKIMLLID